MPIQPDTRHPFDVVIAAPNAAIDSYYTVSSLTVGSVNRASEVLHTAGGKGNNMARAAVMLGGRALSIGIIGGKGGQFIAGELTHEGIAHDMIWTDQETRRCSTILVPTIRQTTVILQPGGPVGPRAREDFAARTLARAPQAPFLALVGSLPPDFPPDHYARIVTALKGSATRVCVDAADETLYLAAMAGAAILKVNLEEFRSAFASDGPWDWARAAGVFADFQKRGMQLLIITDGPNGAYVFADSTAPFRVQTRVETWLSTAGAGDTFLAGLLVALSRGDRLEEAVRYASAAAAANLQHATCGFLNTGDVAHYLRHTSLEPFSVGATTHE